MNEWWKDKQFVEESDSCLKDLETGKDEEFTTQRLDASIEKLRIKKYGK